MTRECIPAPDHLRLTVSPGKQCRQQGGVCGAGVGLSEGVVNPVLGELAEGLETPVQALYLVTLLGFLVVGAYLVVRQV